MMLVVVLIVSFVTCSLAQTPCDTANQTLRMDTDCYEALLSVYPFSGGGNSRNATALMMVCGGSTNTTCSQNIKAYIDNCPSSLMNVVEVLCATSVIHSNQYCVDILPDLQLFNPVQSIFNPISEVCRNSFLIGECSSECSVALQNLSITYGCCLPDLLQFYNDIGSDFLFNTSYGLYLVALPTLLCSIQNPFCNGVLPPGDPDDCSAAFTNLYRQNGGQEDTCSRVIRSTITDNMFALGQYNTVSADCRTRFQDFISSCNGIFDGVSQTEAFQRVNGGFALAAATNNGQSCSMAVSDILTQQNQGEVCIRNYFNRRCSYECRESLMSLTEQYGCCYNSFIAILVGFSTESDDQIEYIILTREIFSLCDVQNPGFCTGINIPYSMPGEQCVSAANQFYAQDDLCTNNYRLLGELSSVSSVQNGANGICTIETCRSRLNDYSNYLLTCRVGSFAIDDDNDDDDDDDNVPSYIWFSNITRHATCRMRIDGTSCYPVLVFSNMTDIINAAFASGACISIFLDATCSNECAQLITQFFDSAGCCIAEYGNAIFGPTVTDLITRSCQIPSKSERCPEITDQQPDRCAIAQNVLLDSASTCGSAFFTFQNAFFDDDDSDITTLRESLNQICQRESCKSAVSEYLEACADVANGFDYDYEDLRMDFNGFACRQSNGNTQGDCFVLDNSDPTIIALGNAFFAGECRTAVSGTCSSACRNTLQTAFDSAGCCVAIIGDVFFRQLQQSIGVTTTVDQVAQACSLPISRDCPEQTTIDGRSAAMERKGLGVMILLFLAGMMVTMFV